MRTSDSSLDRAGLVRESDAAERVCSALRLAGLSNFDLVARDPDDEPAGYCVRFRFNEGHVWPEDARRFLATFVQSTVPELLVYNSRTWNDAEQRVVCVCTRPRGDNGELIPLERLSPIHAAVRRILYDTGILSSPHIQIGDWPNYRRDRHGRFGFRVSALVLRPTKDYAFPRDVLLTVSYQPQGPFGEQERRVAPLLLSIREALGEKDRFRYVLTASDTRSLALDAEPFHDRRSQLGFNVLDVALLREEREWDRV